MYLGTNTITKLYDYLQGYRIAYWLYDNDNPVDKNFFDNFNEFVCRYYGVTTNDNWKGVILEQSFGNEPNALDTFFELFDLFIDNAKVTDTRNIVLSLFDKLISEQDEFKSRLGDNFSVVLTNTVDLIKESALSTLKYDYDGIFDQLKEKAEEIPELKSILTELENQHTS
ncbi:hypothetical protein QEG73_12770 [Chitinophagaceae bacterium 26-R-25]|nr:hypothetical protein [Chitinophagaceae bacterium 26-R-25]